MGRFRSWERREDRREDAELEKVNDSGLDGERARMGATEAELSSKAVTAGRKSDERAEGSELAEGRREDGHEKKSASMSRSCSSSSPSMITPEEASEVEKEKGGSSAKSQRLDDRLADFRRRVDELLRLASCCSSMREAMVVDEAREEEET
jgi:hypothetical protein